MVNKSYIIKFIYFIIIKKAIKIICINSYIKKKYNLKSNNIFKFWHKLEALYLIFSILAFGLYNKKTFYNLSLKKKRLKKNLNLKFKKV